MNDPRRDSVQVTIAFDAVPDPPHGGGRATTISGLVRPPDAPSVRFDGWLELLAVLEVAVSGPDRIRT
jgi:hypothetical protein